VRNILSKRTMWPMSGNYPPISERGPCLPARKTPVLPPPSPLSLQPSGRRQMNSLITHDRPRCSVWSVYWSAATASISDPMLQWTNRLTGGTKITISIRFNFQSKNDFDFDDRNISIYKCKH